MHADTAVINIAFASADWRGVALSNFVLSPFVLDNVLLASVEGFIQGIKHPPGDARREQAFSAWGHDAKALGAGAEREQVYWGGALIPYGSAEHHALIGRAIHARIAQSPGLQRALASTRGLRLAHETGEPDSPTTSLPTPVFCAILERIREQLPAG